MNQTPQASSRIETRHKWKGVPQSNLKETRKKSLNILRVQLKSQQNHIENKKTDSGSRPTYPTGLPNIQHYRWRIHKNSDPHRQNSPNFLRVLSEVISKNIMV